MILSDKMILDAIYQKRIVFTPEMDRDTQLKGASVDLRLGHNFKKFRGDRYREVDPTSVDDDLYYDIRVNPDVPGAFCPLYPGESALGTTVESVYLSPNPYLHAYDVPRHPDRVGNRERDTAIRSYPAVVGRLEGRSSLGRLGLMVHISAGFIDPGFSGKITLEFYNCSPNVIKLIPGIRVCQLTFIETGHVMQPYDLIGRYQGQDDVTASHGVLAR